MVRRKQQEAPVEPREFRSVEEIDRAIAKLGRRVKQLEELDIQDAVFHDTGADSTARSDARNTIAEVFGPNSPENQEHKNLDIWVGGLFMNMHAREIIDAKIRGRTKVIGILNGLISRLKEKREDLELGSNPPPSSYFDKLELHPRIAEVSRDLFVDGHAWEAVFNASKALVNFVKEKSGRHDIDGAPLMRTVFSRKEPVLVFNELEDQSDLDEQEGTMHLFEGAVLAIRNPGGHTFPEGSERRALEYISLLSLLAYRVQEAKRR